MQRKFDLALNASCRSVTECLNRSKVEDRYLISDISPSYIRRTVHSQFEKLKQENEPCHLRHGCESMIKTLRSRQLGPFNNRNPSQQLSLNNVEHRLYLTHTKSTIPGSSDGWPFFPSSIVSGQQLVAVESTFINGDILPTIVIANVC